MYSYEYRKIMFASGKILKMNEIEKNIVRIVP